MKYVFITLVALLIGGVLGVSWQKMDNGPTGRVAVTQVDTTPLQGKPATLTGVEVATANGVHVQPDVHYKKSFPYFNVDPQKGIFCEDADDEYTNELPGINGDGQFYCQCSSDMGCVLTNPHIPETFDDASEARARALVTKAPKGTTCANAVRWDEARRYVGQTLVVVGPLIKVTQRDNVQGNPTWVEIGAAYPNPQRLTLVFWGDRKKQFPEVRPGQLTGKLVCAVGKIEDYKGVAQLELKHERQLRVLK